MVQTKTFLRYTRLCKPLFLRSWRNKDSRRRQSGNIQCQFWTSVLWICDIGNQGPRTSQLRRSNEFTRCCEGQYLIVGKHICLFVCLLWLFLLSFHISCFLIFFGIIFIHLYFKYYIQEHINQVFKRMLIWKCGAVIENTRIICDCAHDLWFLRYIIVEKN